MPTSDVEGKGWVKELYAERNALGTIPNCVLDVGAGEGTYHDLLFGASPLPFPKKHWTAVEIWAPYAIEYGLWSKYDDVIIGDILYIDPRVYAGKLVIIGDVLEHLTEDMAHALISKIAPVCKALLFSVPIIHAPQGWVNGNPYEQHLYHWSFEEVETILAPVAREHLTGYATSYRGEILGYWWFER